MSNGAKSEGTADKALEPLQRDPENVRNVLKRVLKLEQERLYQRQPHLNADIVRIIKEEVK